MFSTIGSRPLSHSIRSSRGPSSNLGHPERPSLTRSRDTVAQALPVPLDPSTLFTAASALVFPAYGAMLFAPRARITIQLISAPALFAVFGVIYAVGLYQAVQTNAFAPLFTNGAPSASYLTIATLLSNKLLVALSWVHLLCLDLFAARYVFLDSIRMGIEHRLSVVLCFMFGPIGILTHVLVRVWTLHSLMKGVKVQKQDGAVTFSFDSV